MALIVHSLTCAPGARTGALLIEIAVKGLLACVLSVGRAGLVLKSLTPGRDLGIGAPQAASQNHAGHRRRWRP